MDPSPPRPPGAHAESRGARSEGFRGGSSNLPLTPSPPPGRPGGVAGGAGGGFWGGVVHPPPPPPPPPPSNPHGGGWGELMSPRSWGAPSAPPRCISSAPRAPDRAGSPRPCVRGS